MGYILLFMYFILFLLVFFSNLDPVLLGNTYLHMADRFNNILYHVYAFTSLQFNHTFHSHCISSYGCRNVLP